MAFRAVHAVWGTVFAHLPDLGCGGSWEAVWKTRPPAPLTCDECGHPMYAKTSRGGLRFFAHAPGAPACALGLESVAHHLLKLELANAARDAGAHAELEVPGPQGAWRADVLATDPVGNWKTALEAQLAPITGADIIARTERMRADSVTSIWFSDRPRPPWLGIIVPSVRLKRPEAAEHLIVAEGLMKFESRSWKPVPTSLTHFLTWAFSRRIGPHTPRAASRYPQRPLPTVWTAPQYISAEDAHLVEEERRRREHETRMAALQVAQEKKRDEIRARNTVSRAKAVDEATSAEHAARTARTGRLREVAIRFRPGIDLALATLADHGVTATVGFSTGDPRYAGGVPLVDESGVPTAVFDPDPGRVRGNAFRLLAGLLLIFPSQTSQRRFEKATKRTRHTPIDGYQTDFVDAPPTGSAGSHPRILSNALTCTCIAPQLVARLQNAEYLAAPSDQMDPAAALFRVQCRACGGKYDRPWRRTSSTPVSRTQHPKQISAGRAHRLSSSSGLG
ncbi:competence protein CoiA [Streptomyces clavifer]|uniref:competence protein CoiA family protein n=1 Tax=Streptomyces clavifer TaxID=68188 RepID=UPI0034114001